LEKPQVDKLIDQQSREAERNKRKQLLWTIERKLAEEYVRPIIYYSRGGTCERPYVKGLTVMVNSVFNGWRMEDACLDKYTGAVGLISLLAAYRH
jgi:peptide/nickel transport system substrate-binding protein